jgi:hypothetical protein
MRVAAGLLALALASCASMPDGKDAREPYVSNASGLRAKWVLDDPVTGHYRVVVTNRGRRPVKYFRELFNPSLPVFVYVEDDGSAEGRRWCIGCGDAPIHDALLEPGKSVDLALAAPDKKVTRIGLKLLSFHGGEYVYWVPPHAD